MFEFSVARKYLIPKKKQMSVSLIALMSVLVISLVVWLVLVFLSVTEGIERSWLDKLTTLNAPLRINPTQNYYSSYFYQIDSLSGASNYSYKTISEKLSSPSTDPYSEEEDMEIPANWPSPERNSDGSVKDPVKTVYRILSALQKKYPGLVFQDYELSGALLRLQLLRPESLSMPGQGSETQSFLTQASYIASFPDKSPQFDTLLVSPTVQDINHLFYLANRSSHGISRDGASFPKYSSQEMFKNRLKGVLENITIKELKTPLNFWKVPFSLLPNDTSFHAIGYAKNGQFTHFILPESRDAFLKQKKNRPAKTLEYGLLLKQNGSLVFKTDNGKVFPVKSSIPLIIENELFFSAQFVASSLEKAESMNDLRFNISCKLQGKSLMGEIAWNGLEISKAVIKTQFDAGPHYPPPWAFSMKLRNGTIQHAVPPGIEHESGVLVSKNFQDSGVRIGDRGYLSYSASSTTSVQEQRIPVYIAGFYDPGIVGIGNKSILVDHEIAHAMCSTSSSFALDKTSSNGIQVWFPSDKTDEIKHHLLRAFASAGIAPYWKITGFKEYDFAKDLLEQFQSDKYLFTLLGIIILIVACCNIISLLILLVNDKKREVGILQAMGASPKSIGAIFAFCGIAMGLVSALIGTGAALLTLHHIDKVVNFLSFLQGHEAFNAAFYGKSLPNQLSSGAVLFVLIATPVISLLAGLIPAIKAARLRPSMLLRSE
ncbi:MAG TPA: FtsX-like permease family protein [Rhabdochlamydiaceae bacterium]|nr:FtsX-like permease family protein [Rhabdochlamydiaceae bacterium]